MKYKYLIFIFTIFISSIFRGQVVMDSLNKNIYLRSIHQIDKNKIELRENSLEWIAKSFNNSNHVIRINNEDKILAKGLFVTGEKYDNGYGGVYIETKVNYTLDIEFKDSKYKIEIFDLIISSESLPYPLSTYFMNKDEFKIYMLNYWSNYNGAGKNFAIKRVENDKKFTKDYEAIKKYGVSILLQIYLHLEKIDKALLQSLKSKKIDTEW